MKSDIWKILTQKLNPLDLSFDYGQTKKPKKAERIENREKDRRLHFRDIIILEILILVF